MKKYERIAWWGMLLVSVIVGQVVNPCPNYDFWGDWWVYVIPFAIFLVFWAWLIFKFKRQNHGE